MPFQPFQGPIPGENYTSDTKNYPWHRPPEFTDIDSAIEWLANHLNDEDTSMSIVSMLEMGLSVATITDLIVTKGVEKGKWALDLGLLLAGPIAHIIVLMAKGYDIKHEMGIEPVNKGYPSKALFNAMKKETAPPSKAQVAKVQKTIEKELATPSGFMGGEPMMEGSLNG